jgi:hypothetical protein
MNDYVQLIHTTKSGVTKRPIEYVPTEAEQSEMNARRLQIRAEHIARETLAAGADLRGSYRHPRYYRYVGD